MIQCEVHPLGVLVLEHPLQSNDSSLHGRLSYPGFELPPNQLWLFGKSTIVVNVIGILGCLAIATNFGFEHEEAHRIGNRDVASLRLVPIEPADSDCLDVACEVFSTVNQTQIERAFDSLNSPYRLVVVSTWKIRKEIELDDVALP